MLVRPSLVPVWDTRRAALQALDDADDAITSIELAKRICYARPNEDDENVTRSTLAWATRAKFATSIPPKVKGEPPSYRITDAGRAIVDAPDHVFF